MLTTHGIELNIEESKFIYTFYGVDFYFSSKTNLERFKNNLINYIEIEEIKLYNKYKVKINAKLFLAFALYKKVEKRGFRVKTEKDFVNEFSSFITNL